MAYATLGSKAVGSIVKLKENGVLTDYLVVHQGLPSSMYDASCNGTWLLRKDIAEIRRWNNIGNDYATSEINVYLSGTFLNRFDTNIKNAIRSIKIPYRPDSGVSAIVNSGSAGLPVKAFLLAHREVGGGYNSYAPDDGARLSHFSEGYSPPDTTKRIATLNGTNIFWWLRTPYREKTALVWGVDTNGRLGKNGNGMGVVADSGVGVRPALIMPQNLYVDNGGAVVVNTAPGVPGSISVPGSIKGGTTITISWGSSSDAEGNLAGYIVERSVNGGGAWSQIYQGGALSTTNAVAFGTASVMYRVKAYDTDGLQSGFRTSGQVTVTNNTAPSAPGSITVPAAIDGGKTITVSWGAASDAEGNLSGYALERSVNGAAYAEIWRGNALSRADAITKGWHTVAYRVRAYDTYTLYSGYTTSPTRTINNNTPPVISCASASGGNLGVKGAGFAVAYTVTDAENNAVTVTETVDGATKRTYAATLGAQNSFDISGDYFMRLLNGAHAMTVTANDGKVTATHTLSFTKSVTAASITLAAPMAADAAITVAALVVSGSIPSDANYRVEVTNNGRDGAPVWEDATSAVRSGINHVFVNQAAAKGFAFNFRVTVSRGSGGQGGHISSIQGGFQ